MLPTFLPGVALGYRDNARQLIMIKKLPNRLANRIQEELDTYPFVTGVYRRHLQIKNYWNSVRYMLADNRGGTIRGFRDRDGYSSDGLCEFLQPRGMVLEVGCGDGRNSMPITDKGLKLVGIDILVRHRENLSSLFEMVQADAYCLPFGDGSFDYVLCSELLEHLEEPESGIIEIHRVMKNGGTAVFTCPILNIPVKPLIPIYRRLAGIPQHSYREHIQVFSAKEITKTLSQHFDIEAIKYVDFLSLLQRRLGIGYSFDTYLSSIAAKITPLCYLAGGGWFKVQKGSR